MKPSDHLKVGECPFCHGTGSVSDTTIYLADITVEDRLGICPLCHGSKKWPPPGDDE
jgi:excinuclease UvrABC ATPase subunit